MIVLSRDLLLRSLLIQFCLLALMEFLSGSDSARDISLAD